MGLTAWKQIKAEELDFCTFAQRRSVFFSWEVQPGWLTTKVVFDTEPTVKLRLLDALGTETIYTETCRKNDRKHGKWWKMNRGNMDAKIKRRTRGMLQFYECIKLSHRCSNLAHSLRLRFHCEPPKLFESHFPSETCWTDVHVCPSNIPCTEELKKK